MQPTDFAPFWRSFRPGRFCPETLRPTGIEWSPRLAPEIEYVSGNSKIALDEHHFCSQQKF